MILFYTQASDFERQDSIDDLILEAKQSKEFAPTEEQKSLLEKQGHFLGRIHKIEAALNENSDNAKLKEKLLPEKAALQEVQEKLLTSFWEHNRLKLDFPEQISWMEYSKLLENPKFLKGFEFEPIKTLDQFTLQSWMTSGEKAFTKYDTSTDTQNCEQKYSVTQRDTMGSGTRYVMVASFKLIFIGEIKPENLKLIP